MKSQTEYKLKSPPDDAVSAVKFGPHTNQFLLVSSWDGNVRLYDVTSNNLRHKYSHESPVLDCCFTVSILIKIMYVNLNNIYLNKIGCCTFIQWWFGQYSKIFWFQYNNR